MNVFCTNYFQFPQALAPMYIKKRHHTICMGKLKLMLPIKRVSETAFQLFWAAR